MSVVDGWDSAEHSTMASDLTIYEHHFDKKINWKKKQEV